MSEAKTIKEGVLLKMSQQKKKISPKNYKERLFVLTSQALMYYEQEKGKKKRKKGSILTDRIFCVEKVEPEKNAPVERKFPFQVAYDECILYIFAEDETNRTDWIEAVMQVIRDNDKFSTKYHKGFWVDGTFQCCGQTTRNAPGCSHSDQESMKLRSSRPPVPSVKNRGRVQLPPIPEDESSTCVEVVALSNYTANKPGEISLVKGRRYISVEKMCGEWWKIRDRSG